MSLFISLTIRTAVSLLYAVATLPLLFVVSVIRGIADSAKGPSASAMIADHTQDEDAQAVRAARPRSRLRRNEALAASSVALVSPMKPVHVDGGAVAQQQRSAT